MNISFASLISKLAPSLKIKRLYIIASRFPMLFESVRAVSLSFFLFLCLHYTLSIFRWPRKPRLLPVVKVGTGFRIKFTISTATRGLGYSPRLCLSFSARGEWRNYVQLNQQISSSTTRSPRTRTRSR